MDLKDIAAVSGKGGLFKVLKPTRTGVILESIDESKAKMIANANARVSLLKEISVYTTGKESSLPLENVFKNIFSKYGENMTVNPKSPDDELRNFLETVVPDYDSEKVYNSDIRKIVSWYSILLENFPDIFEEKTESKSEKDLKKQSDSAAAKESKVKEIKEEKVEKPVKKETKAASEKTDKEKPKAKAKAAAKKK